MAQAIGIDVGGTHLRAARVDGAGAILAEARRPCDRRPEAVLRDVLALVEEVRAPGVAALGVGLPSRVDAAAREVFPGGYVDLTCISFAARVEEATGLAVALENDGAMALLAERALGAARGCDAALLLTVGTGIGGAVLDGGRLLRGRGTAGQLGHLVVREGGHRCACGRQGCLETESSGSALARHLAEAGLPQGTRAESLLARPSDPAAERALAAWAGPMRRAILSLAAALRPEVVLLGGGAGGAMAQALARLPPDPSGWFDAPVRPAALGDVAGVVGAALAGLDLIGLGRTRRALLVNGVPASGKSRVARAMADALGWPLLSLDTVKGPFLAELPPGDRPFNRSLGRAAYAAIWDTLAESPSGTGVVIDAWFGFQPLSLLDDGLARAGVAQAAELWCEAPPEEVGRRYAARVPARGPGHPGLDYVPELVELARRAVPTGRAPVLRIDTTRPLDRAGALAWARRALAGRPPESA